MAGVATFTLICFGFASSRFGIGTLIAGHISAQKQGVTLRLCSLGSKFHEMLQITKLVTVFDVYDTEAAAISSF
jgi:anti-sigma B factor antagonist